MTEQELKKLIKECEEAGLSPWQIVEVKLGNYMGLTREEILSYAKLENPIETMERLRMQLQFPEVSEAAQESDQQNYEKLENITMKAVSQMSVTIQAAVEQMLKVAADININAMEELNKQIAELMYENKVLKERRSVWNLEESNSDMKKSFWSRYKKKRRTTENGGILELLAGSGELYSDEQIKELSIAYENGLSMQAIYKLANPELGVSKMKRIRQLAERLEGFTTGQQEEKEEDPEMQIPESDSYYVPEEDEAFSSDAEDFR